MSNNKTRLQLSFQGGKDSFLLLHEEKKILSYEKDRELIHDCFGGEAYYTSRSGLSGAGWIPARPELYSKALSYRVDCAEGAAYPDRHKTGIFVPLNSHSGMSEQHPIVLKRRIEYVHFLFYTGQAMLWKIGGQFFGSINPLIELEEFLLKETHRFITVPDRDGTVDERPFSLVTFLTSFERLPKESHWTNLLPIVPHEISFVDKRGVLYLVRDGFFEVAQPGHHYPWLGQCFDVRKGVKGLVYSFQRDKNPFQVEISELAPTGEFGISYQNNNTLPNRVEDCWGEFDRNVFTLNKGSEGIKAFYENFEEDLGGTFLSWLSTSQGKDWLERCCDTITDPRVIHEEYSTRQEKVLAVPHVRDWQLASGLESFRGERINLNKED